MSTYQDILAQASPQQLAIAQRKLGASAPQSTSGGGARGAIISQLPSLLAAGASLIPGVGTVAAAGLGGVGEAGRELLSGEGLSAGNIGKEALLSAIPGGAGKLLKLAGGGAKAAKGAEEVAQVAGAGTPANVLERFAGKQAGKARGIKPGAKTAGEEQLGVQDAAGLNAHLDSRGIKNGSAADQLAALEKDQAGLGKQIGDTVEKSNRPLASNELATLQGRIQEETSKIAGLSKTNPTTALLGTGGEALVKIGGGQADHAYAQALAEDVKGITDLKGANDLRKRLDADSINYGRGSNSPDPLKEQIAKAYRRALDETVSGAIPELKGVQQLYGKGATAGEYLKDAAKNPPGMGRFAGNGPLISGETVQSAQAGLGGVTSKLAELMQKVAPLAKLTGSFVGQEAGRGAAGVLASPEAPAAGTGADAGVGADAAGMTPDSSQAGLDDTATDVSGAMGVDPSDPAVLQGLYKQALAAPDAKTQGQMLDLVSKIIDIQGKLNPSSTKKPLSTAAATATANSKSGLRAIDQLQGLLDKNPNLANKNALGGLLGNAGQRAGGTQDFEAAKNEIIDVISRTRSGAALTPAEIANYKKDLPRLGDTKEVIDQKLNRFRLLFNDQLQGMENGSPALETVGVGGL